MALDVAGRRRGRGMNHVLEIAEILGDVVTAASGGWGLLTLAYRHVRKGGEEQARREAECGERDAQVAVLQERVNVLERELRMMRAVRSRLWWHLRYSSPE